MINSNFSISPLTEEELPLIMGWAQREGWNPGLYDGSCFWAADSMGFFAGRIDAQIICSIASIAYSKDYGFIGLFIVKPEFRKSGYGAEVFKTAMAYLGERNVGLDAVVHMSDTYTKWGFKKANRNIRYSIPKLLKSVPSSDTNIRLIDLAGFEQINDYDKDIFTANRKSFLKKWLYQPQSTALTYTEHNRILGYAVLRTCIEGFKIGPLFADNYLVASQLLNHLLQQVEERPIFIDMPCANLEAMHLAENYNMEPVFQTDRMYTKYDPINQMHKIFGITTFELG